MPALYHNDKLLQGVCLSVRSFIMKINNVTMLLMTNEATIEEIRLANARALAATEKTRAAFAAKIGVEPSRISQIIGKNPTKQIGTDTARRIELAYSKKKGWMDVRHGANVIQIGGKNKNDLEIPQYDTGGAMGTGILLRDQPGEIHGWRVTPEWIEKNVKNHSGIGNLAIVTGFGDSMRGMFNPGDPLLVDRGITSVEYDGVYFFRVGDEGFIKRLQRVPGEGLVAISENKAYKEWIVKPEMDFEVFARVVKVWIGTEF